MAKKLVPSRSKSKAVPAPKKAVAAKKVMAPPFGKSRAAKAGGY